MRKRFTKKCPVCGNVFTAYVRRQLVCCHTCKVLWRKAKYKLKTTGIKKPSIDEIANVAKKLIAEEITKTPPVEKKQQKKNKILGADTTVKSFYIHAHVLRRCHDCGKPTPDYRCPSCRKKHLAGGGYNTDTRFNGDEIYG